MTAKEKISTDDEKTWELSYKQSLKTLNEEANRFWARFNISLVINAGLIVAFSAMLGFLNNSELIATFGAVSISIIGIVFSIIWIRITEIAREYQIHYVGVVKEIEKNHIPENNRVLPPKGKIKGSITKTALLYPKSFLVFWIVLTVIFAGYQIYQYLN